MASGRLVPRPIIVLIVRRGTYDSICGHTVVAELLACAWLVLQEPTDYEKNIMHSLDNHFDHEAVQVPFGCVDTRC